MGRWIVTTGIVLLLAAMRADAATCCQYSHPNACAKPLPNGSCGNATTVPNATCAAGRQCVPESAVPTPPARGRR